MHTTSSIYHLCCWQKCLLIGVLLCALAFPNAAVKAQSNGSVSKPRSTTIKTVTTKATAAGAAQTLADAQLAVVQIEAVGSFTNPSETSPTLQAGRGSGFIIDPSGIAVTNHHVVTGAALLKVYVEGYDRPLNARVLGVSECADLAVIDIEGEGFPYLRWYDGATTVGLDIYAAGYPLGDPEYTLTRGIISKARANGQTPWSSLESVLQHDADINSGNSGGPLLTAQGAVVGVNYAVNREYRQSFAIDQAEAMTIIEQLRLGSDVDSLGINGQAMSDGDQIYGIWVYSVKSGSPAEQAGLQGGDFILSLEGIDMGVDGTLQSYCEVVRSHHATDTLKVEAYRTADQTACQGQINGRVLQCTEAAPVPTPTPSEAAAIHYGEVQINDGEVTFAAPTHWEEIKSEPWLQGEEVIGLWIDVAPDLQRFNDLWDSSGFSLGIAQLATGETTATVLDRFAVYADECTYKERKPFELGEYSGHVDRWENCKETHNTLLIAAFTPADHQFIGLLNFQTVEPTELAIADQLIATLVVNQPATETTPAPAAAPPATPAATVIVQVETLNIRTGPGVAYGLLGRLQQGDRLAVVAQAYSCTWLQVQLPDNKLGWIAGQLPYATLEGSCAEIPAGTFSPAPIGSGGGGSGCILFQNHFNDEATVTLTSKDGKVNKTIKVGRKANHRECVPSGSYTYTIDVPPPWGSINGKLEISRGRTITFPIHG